MPYYRLKKADKEFFSRMEDTIDTLTEEPYQKYWATLGQFIHTFSIAEHKLLLVLRKEARIKDKIAGIVFSGTRGEQASKWIRAIREIYRPRRLQTYFKRALDQFGVISTVRNNVIHWGARYDRAEKYLLVSNKKFTPAPHKLKEFPISVEILNAMIRDLHTVIASFDFELYPDKSSTSRFVMLTGPWRYKPPQPNPNKRHRDPKARKRRQLSSRRSR